MNFVKFPIEDYNLRDKKKFPISTEVYSKIKTKPWNTFIFKI